MQEKDDENPNHLGVIGGRLIPNTTDQGRDPKNEAAWNKKEKDEK
jgi:hypothetical protein